MSLPGSLAKSINRYQNVLYSGLRKGLERKGIVSVPGWLAKSINRYIRAYEKDWNEILLKGIVSLPESFINR